MIVKSKIKNQKSKLSAGFTLIEILASVIVLVAVGSVIAGIVTSSLRGTNKTNTIENIRQNGNYALNQISKDITYAQSFDGKNTGFSNDGITYYTGCILSTSPTPTPVTPYKFIKVRSTNDVVTQYNCDGSVLTANGMSLIDTALVSLSSCSFKCVQEIPTDIPIIQIGFSLDSGGIVEKSGSILFETSVTMRNYKK